MNFLYRWPAISDIHFRRLLLMNSRTSRSIHASPHIGFSRGWGLATVELCLCELPGSSRGDSAVRCRTQSSVAISADDQSWFLLNVSADVRQQIATYPDLGPSPGTARGTSIAGCLLTDAEIDHVSGLLQLREGLSFPIFSTALVRRWLNTFFPIEPILTSFSERPWLEFPLESPWDLAMVDGQPARLQINAFECGRDVPRYVSEQVETAVGSVIGFRIVDNATGGVLVYAPGVAEINDSLRQAAVGSDLILLDGSFWSDDEPNSHGISAHVSANGTPAGVWRRWKLGVALDSAGQVPGLCAYQQYESNGERE